MAIFPIPNFRTMHGYYPFRISETGVPTRGQLFEARLVRMVDSLKMENKLIYIH